MTRLSCLYGLLVLCLISAAFLGCSRDPNVRKQKYFESGQRYFQKGKYREAAIQFANALQVDSRFVDAHYRLAQSYMRLQNWNQAYEELDRTVQLQPDHTEAQLDLANLLLLSKDFKDFNSAQQHIDAVLARNPNSAPAHVAEANLKARQNDMSTALREMQKAIDLAPDHWDMYQNLAILQMQANQPDAAEASFKKAVSLNPRETTLHLTLGGFYQQRSRFAEAEQEFKAAIENDRANPDARSALARLYLAQGKKVEAEQFLKQAKADLPDNPAGYRMLGDYYFAIGDLDKAVAEYSSLYQQHQNDLLTKKNYIQLLILKNRVADAKKLNEEVLKANPNDGEALVYRGQIQIREGQARDAAETLQQVLQNEPDNAVAHYHLGIAFDMLGNVSRAEGEWRNAVRLNANITDAQKALAAAEMRNGEWDALRDTSTQIINLQPNVPDGYALRAIAEINRKQVSDAENDLQKAMDVAPQSPVGYVQMGNLRASQNRLADALSNYEKALDRDANSAEAMLGIANVYLSQKKVDSAIARVQAQLGKQPGNSNFHYILGSLLVEKKDFAGSEAELKRAIDLDKSNVNALLKLGQVEVALGAVDQAIATYQASARNNPSDIRFYILTGELYEAKRDWSQAKDMYQKALQIQADNPLASNNLAYVMLEQGGNVDVALSMAQIARRGMPDSPNAADTLGYAYLEKGAYNSAIDLFKQAIQLDKNPTPDPTFYYHLGLAYEKTQQARLAKQQFERALKISPTFSDADDARRHLAD
ncbi:MAG TPA: tetratricopeptide repeat protein [Terriglobales bacterium]|nr:tetratricopeptide repeat protein [Terriglobales bacterium]